LPDNASYSTVLQACKPPPERSRLNEPASGVCAEGSERIMNETARIVEHIRQRLAATEIDREPFTHCVVQGLLPDDVYDEILNNWPPQELAKASNWASRREIHVAQNLANFPKETQKTWQQVVEWSQAARDLVYEKFRPYLGEKFIPMLGRQRSADLKLFRQRGPAAFIATYTGNLSLFTHVDHPFIAVNGFLYVSEKDVNEDDLGTVLYQSFGLSLPHNEIKLPEHLLERYLRKAKTVGYRRNVYLAYINSPHSFHGVEPADIGDRVRRLLMFGTVLDAKTFTEEELRRLSPRRND
jgi:hypothetical protein